MGTKQTKRQGTRLPAMRVGTRSAIAVCEGRKTSLVAPGAEQSWLSELKVGEQFRLNFMGRHFGWAQVEATGCCYHEHIIGIPGCGRGHDAAAVDAEEEEGWDRILFKALCAGHEPVPAEEMEARAAKGWYVVDFVVRRRHGGWCAAMGIDADEPR